MEKNFLWSREGHVCNKLSSATPDHTEENPVPDDWAHRVRHFLYQGGDCMYQKPRPVEKSAEQNVLPIADLRLLESLLAKVKEKVSVDGSGHMFGSDDPFAMFFPDLERFLRERRCAELRANKKTGEKFTLDDLAYIFNEYDNKTFVGGIALLIGMRDGFHPDFIQLREDLYHLGITFDDVEMQGKTLAQYLTS
ncbi:MAG: hypothetical protein WC819_04630 [Parcubacteria group bacterium]|jgi:hypothetical protein